MRVLRSSCFANYDLPPLTLVFRDHDLTDTIESAAIRSQQPGTFVVHDIFEMPNGTIKDATRKAMQRVEPQREQNMALLFFWALRFFNKLTTDGQIMMDKPAPLTVEDIQFVFDQLKSQPEYRGFHITSFARDGTMVRLVKGKIH